LKSTTLKGLRNIFYVIIFVAIFFAALPAGLRALGVPPAALPVIQLPGEPLIEHPLLTIAGQELYLTNTLVATLIADLILILAAVLATRKMELVPKGWQNTFEGLIEVLYGFAEQAAGSKARRIFPWMATIFLLLLVANWMELIPGVDSIGILHEVSGTLAGHARQHLFGNVYMLDVDPQYRQGIPPGTAGALGHLYVVTPFVRAAATDLNLTLGLAITAMVAVQVFGVIELGPAYFFKFVNVPAMAKWGVMDFIVGLIESVSEFIKIVSFGFRLFGNIFAGQILLFVMAFLIPFIVPAVFYGLEVFVGLIQAFIFAMLTLVFISMAMVGHHAEDEHH
jgi:F-type H+-transporting ATPase subunit a